MKKENDISNPPIEDWMEKTFERMNESLSKESYVYKLFKNNNNSEKCKHCLKSLNSPFCMMVVCQCNK